MGMSIVDNLDEISLLDIKGTHVPHAMRLKTMCASAIAFDLQQECYLSFTVLDVEVFLDLWL